MLTKVRRKVSGKVAAGAVICGALQEAKSSDQVRKAKCENPEPNIHDDLFSGGYVRHFLDD